MWKTQLVTMEKKEWKIDTERFPTDCDAANISYIYSKTLQQLPGDALQSWRGPQLVVMVMMMIDLI